MKISNKTNAFSIFSSNNLTWELSEKYKNLKITPKMKYAIN